MTDPHDRDDLGGAHAADDPWSHLRAAALELIAAGRSFLDAADAAVRSDTAPTVLRDLADLGRDVVAKAAQAAAESEPDPPSSPAPDDYIDIPLDD